MASFALAQLFSNVRAGVSANDPETFATTLILPTSIALVAASIPGRHRMEGEPMAALQVD